MEIIVKKLTAEESERMGVASWPIWTKEVSVFDWYYDEQEMCQILEGRVTVTAGDKKVEFGKGDFVIFPKGLACVWDIKEPVRKHYHFG